MVAPRLILILGDQLSADIAALRAGDPLRDVVVMAEMMGEGTHVPHHPQKIALILTAMRKFCDMLQGLGWRVLYSALDDPANSQTLSGEVLRRAAEVGASEVIATRPGAWRVVGLLDDLPLRVTQLPDDRFLCSQVWFDTWAKDRRVMRMEHFYREMRRMTGFLMDGDAPAGGQWNYDHDNRKPAKPDLLRPRPPRFAPDAVAEGVLALVEAKFPSHFGALRPFGWATDRAGAVAALDHFITHALPRFGDEQDAMLRDDPTLSHALLSPYLNLGLLSPREVCDRAEAAYRAGRVPIAAAEGFIRQIIGWREFIRGVYFQQGPGYERVNTLGHDRPLPPVYWGAPTRMACMAAAVGQTRDLGYAHHIQRLMVTGNFALLSGIDPAQVHEWYLSVYVDAVEWVEVPNTLGMSQFADGGVVGSKPYVSSGAYIDRMSDYCGSCHYRVKEKTGPCACPFNPLYWHFLTRHRERFQGNPRMAQMYRTWDRMDEGHRDRVMADAEGVLGRLERGEMV